MWQTVRLTYTLLKYQDHAESELATFVQDLVLCEFILPIRLQKLGTEELGRWRKHILVPAGFDRNVLEQQEKEERERKERRDRKRDKRVLFPFYYYPHVQPEH